MAQQAFEDSEGKFDYAFNLAAETKYSQTEEVRSLTNFEKISMGQFFLKKFVFS